MKRVFLTLLTGMAGTEDLTGDVREMRGRLVDQAALASLVFALPASVLYMIMARSTGFSNGRFLFAAVFFAFLAMALFHRRLSLGLRAGLVIGVWFCLGAAGLLAWGLAGIGLLFLLAAGGLTALLFGAWAGAIAIVASLGITAVVGVGIQFGVVSLEAAHIAPSHMPNLWIFHTLLFGLFAATIVFILGRQHKWLILVLESLKGRTTDYEATTRKLEAEIAVRQRVERALRGSEERMRSLVECARDSFYVVNGQGRFVDVNTHACLATGYSRQELLSMSATDLDIDLDKECFEQVMERLGEEKTVILQGTHQRKDGRTFPVEVSVGRMGDGPNFFAVALARDTSERKATEQVLEFQYRSEKLVTEISAPFINLPPETIDRNIEAALEKVCRFCGVDAAYILLADEKEKRLALTHLWQADSSVLSRQALQALSHRSMPWQKALFEQQEIYVVSCTKDLPAETGIDRQALLDQRIRSFFEAPMSGPERRIGVIGFASIQDYRHWTPEEAGLYKMIGQVFSSALQRKASEEALRESEATMRSIVRAVPTGIGMASGRTILRGNNQLFEMLGYKAEDLVGRSFRILYSDEQEYDRVGRLLYTALEEKGRAVIESRWLRRDGTTIDILLNAAVVEPSGPKDRITFTALDITERKRAERALKESARNYREIFNATQEAIFIHDAETGAILSINDAVKEMFGYDEQEALTLPLGGFISENGAYTQEKAVELIRKAVKEGPQVFEWRSKRKDGQIFWTEVALKSSSIGGQGRVLAVVRDVDNRKQAERALRESEDKFSKIFHGSPIWIDLTSIDDARILEVNQSFCKSTGYDREEVIGRGAMDLALWVDPGQWMRAVEWIDAEGRLSAHPIKMRMKDGSERGFLWSAESVDFGGQRCLLNAMVDVTELKQAEVALRESEERFRSLVENTLAGICIVREDRIVYMNPEQEKILGPIQGSGDIHRLPLYPDDTGKFMQHYRSVKEHDFPHLNLEIRICPGGSSLSEENMRWVHCNMSKIPFQGQPAILITMVDTSRTKELEKLVQLREKMVSLGHVAAGIAHEIRNPLSGINVLLDGIRDNFEDPGSADDIRRLLDESQKASNKIAGVIKRVLDFSRPSEPHLTLTDINIPIREALELSKTTLRKAGISLDVELAEPLPPLYIDDQMIEQVVLNLLNNAVEALKNTNGTRKVRVRSHRRDAYVVFSISDSGPGIPEPLRQKIFDPFFTTRSDGSGIGLSLCQRLIADHGGTITASTSEWGGAEFSIRIPSEKRMAIR